MQPIGTLSLGPEGQAPAKVLELTDIVRAAYRDHRLCTVARAEDNTFLLSVENPQSTGRATNSQMYLSEESMLALVSCVFLFYQHNGIDISGKLQEVADSASNGNLEYEFASSKDGEDPCSGSSSFTEK